MPATGSVAALIEKATGRSPYYVGKPNPLMMRSALRRLGAHSESTLMIGDRMDTDVHSGIERGCRPFWCSPAYPRRSRPSAIRIGPPW